MPIFKVIILAIVQGLAELLPVSSSAHVIVAEKLMGLDPSSPQMTLLLVMLHTGTMFAVIAYFWKTWKETFFSSGEAFKRFAVLVIWATFLTGIVGEVLKKIIEKTLFRGAEKAEIEQLFSHLELIAPALAAVGVLILIAGLLERRHRNASDRMPANSEDFMTTGQAGWMGFVQGLALPFRGFSRSGSTISAGMLVGAAKEQAERFSFALAVVLTPPVVATGGAAPAQGLACRRGCRSTHRPPCLAGRQPARHGVLLHRRNACAQMAQQLAGNRPLVSLRDLLPDRLGRGLLSPRARVLEQIPKICIPQPPSCAPGSAPRFLRR